MNESGKTRDAYVPNLRVRLASDVASLCAVGLLIGLLAAAVTWWEHSALFDLATNSRVTVKLGIGYLGGPVAILIALPLRFGMPGQVALERWYKRRLLLAATLWLVGLGVLIAKLAGLDGYTLEAGAFVTTGLIVVGLAATLAMWPHAMREVGVNPLGLVRAPSRHDAA